MSETNQNQVLVLLEMIISKAKKMDKNTIVKALESLPINSLNIEENIDFEINKKSLKMEFVFEHQNAQEMITWTIKRK